MLGIIAIAFFVIVGCSAQRMVFQPFRRMETTPQSLNWPVEDVFFRAPDGTRLNGWYFPNTNAPYTILLSHGNGGNLCHRLELIGILLQTGVSVFAFDYRGYGRSEGTPSEKGVYQDAQAAYDWLRARGQTNIIAYGESLGGAVATELALTNAVAGLILQSTFTSVPDVASEMLPWFPAKWFLRTRFATRDKLARIRVPVLILHSRADTVIGYRHAERNFAAAREPKYFHELRGDHNDPFSVNADRYQQALREFLAAIRKHSEERPPIP